MKPNIYKERLLQVGNALLKVATRNVGLKILSVIFALMLWSYVISSNASITRLKTHSGLQGYVSGQITLDAYNLAMISDPTDALSNITVEVEVPLAYYSSSTSENVQVSLDLSSVRTAGTQEVPLKATTAYGTIKRIYPASVTMTFEPLDSRSIPVNLQLIGTEDGYWYNCARLNPSQITISGATSIVQGISSVVVKADVSRQFTSYNTSCTIELRDSAGNVIPTSLLNRSSSSVSLTMEVYPTKEIEVSADPADVLVGEVAEGYVVESITIQPGALTVAADQDLLEDLDLLIVDPIDVEGAKQSFTRRATISGLSNIRYISSEQVYVNVHIVEETVSRMYDTVKINYVGLDDGLTVVNKRESVAIYATGPRSNIENLDADSIIITVDLSGLGEGTHEIAVVPDPSTNTDIEFRPDVETITVELERIVTE